jgi:hypothetical protein
MLKAYEQEERATFYNVFLWKTSGTYEVGQDFTLGEVLEMARQKKEPVTFYTLEWADSFEKVEA